MNLKRTAATSRHLLGCMATAAALTLALAPNAWADQSTVKVRGQAVNGESLNLDASSNQPFSGANTGASVDDTHHNQLAFLQLEAKTRSTLNPKVLASTFLINQLTPSGHTGLSSALASSQATFEDTITITGPAADVGKVVRLQNVMSLNSEQELHNQGFDPAGASANASLTNEAKVEVSGTGLGAGPWGGSTYGFFDSTITRDHAETTSGPTVPNVFISMDVVIGQPTAISFTLTTTADVILFDDTGGAQLSSNLDYFYNLRWGDTTQITLLDAAGHDTGRTPGGLSIASDTGFGFFDGTTPGGVPEPASWALMIAGFGLAGATLRRRGMARAA